MTKRWASRFGVALAVTLSATPSRGQTLMEAAQEAAPVGAPSPAPANPQAGPAKKLFVDVAHDYRNFFSRETAWWLGAGGGAAVAVHPADQPLSDWAQTSAPSMPGAEWYGSELVQMPVAIAWWIAGSAAGSDGQASAGRDLLRGQIAAVSWTYAIKLTVNRTRPNGESHSFPSGHASTSFTTAMVLQEHFGWKVGVPAFAMAAYTGVERVAANQHWASDVVFGAALGMAGARTVTLHVRKTRVSMAPHTVPGGAGVIGVARW
jgi:membrane-associated phospholipid phosphatase